MSQQYALVLIVVGGIILILLLGIGLILLWRRYRAYGLGLGLMRRVLTAEESEKATYGSISSKLWIGQGNPTESIHIDILGGRQRKSTPEEQRSDEEILKCSHSALNFCRSTGHERTLKSVLPSIGKRMEKFHGIIDDARVNQRSIEAGGPVEVNLLMTQITPSETNTPTLLPITSTKSIAAWRTLLTQLNHPYVLPTYDAAVSIDARVFVLRPWSDTGSLRDRLFGDVRPTSAYGAKYIGIDPSTGLTFNRPGRGLRLEHVIKFTRQILEGMRYLETQGLPYYHLHTGNVIIVNGNAQLSDYENSFLGLKHRLHKKLRRLPNVDPQFAAFVCLVYEISTGIEPQVIKRSTNMADASNLPPGCTLDLVLRDPNFVEVDRLIQLIIRAQHSITFDELLAHPLFRDLKLPPIIRDPTRIIDSRTARVIQPVLTYYAESFPGHPNQCGITLPVKPATGSGGGGGSNANSPRHGPSSSPDVDSLSTSLLSSPDRKKKKSKRTPTDRPASPSRCESPSRTRRQQRTPFDDDEEED